MSSWVYKGKEVLSTDSMPDGAVGFVYEVTYLKEGKKYIGKKILEVKRKLPPLKGKKRVRRIVKESDWKKYYGSNEEIKKLISEGGEGQFKREILEFAFSKVQLTYLETRYQFDRRVLERDDYFNSNILGKFYKGKV
jgi:hypothetical protein